MSIAFRGTLVAMCFTLACSETDRWRTLHELIMAWAVSDLIRVMMRRSSGNVATKVVPRPGLLSKHTSPP